MCDEALSPIKQYMNLSRIDREMPRDLRDGEPRPSEGPK